jgi:hypothetical protein
VVKHDLGTLDRWVGSQDRPAWLHTGITALLPAMGVVRLHPEVTGWLKLPFYHVIHGRLRRIGMRS